MTIATDRAIFTWTWESMRTLPLVVNTAISTELAVCRFCVSSSLSLKLDQLHQGVYLAAAIHLPKVAMSLSTSCHFILPYWPTPKPDDRGTIKKPLQLLVQTSYTWDQRSL